MASGNTRELGQLGYVVMGVGGKLHTHGRMAVLSDVLCILLKWTLL